MSKFTGFSEKSGRSVGSDAIALNLSKELDSTDCSNWVLEN